MKKQITIDLELPSLPNFLRSKDGYTAVSVADCSKKKLEEIGRLWTKALVKKSKKK